LDIFATAVAKDGSLGQSGATPQAGMPQNRFAPWK
jgi:hypothetical protein